MNHDADITDHLTVSEMEIIEQVCTCFEEQWRSDNPPAIEELLADHDGRLRKPLVAELIKLDIDYRQRAGQIPERHDYLSRFPDDAKAIEMAFSNESVTIGHSLKVSRIFDSAADHPPIDSLKLESEFRIERFHARGGLGEVYLARDQSLDRIVAIKFPRNRNPDSPDRIRLEREAEITSRLKHPGIVPVHASSHGSDNLPCYIMQFIEGKTLRDAILEFHVPSQPVRINKFASWEFRRLLQRLVAVGNTVAYAHNQGVIHRDIKPANIMLGQFGETFLLDWGLARTVDRNVPPTESKVPFEASTPQTTWRCVSDGTPGETEPGQPMGTPEFASPEQIMGRVQDHSQLSDVYSLGATLYFLLLGQRPIDSEDLTNLKTASALRRIVPPKKLDARVPMELEAICLKAISFEPADRFANAQSFVDELERYLADEPVTVSRQSWTTGIRRWIRKKPRLASGVATGVAVAMVGISLSTWMLSRKSDELAKSLRRQEQSNKELAEARDSAQAYASKTMGALKTLSSNVVQQWFVEQESFSEKERDFLQSIVSQYQDLARSESNARFARVIEAEANQKVGRIQILLGQDTEALATLEKAVQLLTPLPKDATEVERVLKAKCCMDRGSLLVAKGDVETGLQALNEGVGIFMALVEDYPEEPNYVELVASAYGTLGAKYVGIQQTESAIAEFTEAIAIMSKLVEQYPENDYYLGTLANNIGYLAGALAQSGDHRSAQEEFQNAVREFELLDARNALYSDVSRASQVLVHYIGNANTLMALGRIDDAQEQFERVIDAAHRTIEMYPTFSGSFISLARAHYGLSLIFSNAKNFEMAVSETGLAVEAAANAFELSPDAHQVLTVCGVIQLAHATALKKNGDLDKAESAYFKGIEYGEERFHQNPSFENRMRCATDYYRLAMFQLKLAKKSAAIEHYQKAIALLESAPPEEQNQPILTDQLLILRKKLKILLASDD